MKELKETVSIISLFGSILSLPFALCAGIILLEIAEPEEKWVKPFSYAAAIVFFISIVLLFWLFNEEKLGVRYFETSIFEILNVDPNHIPEIRLWPVGAIGWRYVIVDRDIYGKTMEIGQSYGDSAFYAYGPKKLASRAALNALYRYVKARSESFPSTRKEHRFGYILSLDPKKAANQIVR